MRRTPALILGGGPAGAAAAIMIARSGRSAQLIERSAAPRDVVCGAFLGWDALAALEQLGINAAALGAVPIDGVRLVSAKAMAEAPLPHRAAGLSRRRLDEALMEAASEAGAEVRRGVAVRSADEERLRIELDDGTRVEAEALFLATGKHELRGLGRRGEGSGAAAVGLRTRLLPSPELKQGLSGFVELHLFDGGYAGLLLQEDGSANLCLSASGDRLKRAGGIPALLEELGRDLPLLRQRLAHAPDGLSWEAIAGVPYGWRARSTSPGLFRLGDQAAVIASLAGDGIAIALSSGIEAAHAYEQHGPAGAKEFQTSFSARAARPLAIASLLRRGAEHGASRGLLISLARTAPGLASFAARLTRIR